FGGNTLCLKAVPSETRKYNHTVNQPILTSFTRYDPLTGPIEAGASADFLLAEKFCLSSDMSRSAHHKLQSRLNARRLQYLFRDTAPSMNQIPVLAFQLTSGPPAK